MRMRVLLRCFGSVATVCAVVLSLAGIAQSPAARANDCETLFTEAFWQQASADDVEVALAQGGAGRCSGRGRRHAPALGGRL